MKIDRSKMMDKVRAISTANVNTGRIGYIKKFEDQNQRLIRILPPKSLLVFLRDNRNSNKTYDLTDYPWREIGVHYGISANNKDRVYCPKAMLNLPCPICETVEELRKSKTKDDLELANKMRLQYRFQFLAIEKTSDTDIKEGPKFWEISRTPYNKIIGIFQDTDYGDISDPEDGYDLKVTRIAFKMTEQDQYKILPAKKASPILSLEDGDIDWDTLFGYLETLPNLSDAISVFSYDELSDLLDGKVSLKGLWDEHRQPTEVADEEKDDDEDDEDEDEKAEEETPKVSVRRRR
jgi:hypothetical protein